MTIEIEVKLSGALLAHKVLPGAEQIIAEEVMDKIAARLSRKGAQGSGGRGLGVKNNIITQELKGLSLDVMSTRIYPRTRGYAWGVRNIGIVKSMAPRVIRKAARRISGDA